MYVKNDFIRKYIIYEFYNNINILQITVALSKGRSPGNYII